MIPDATKRMEAALKRHVAAIMAGDADSVMRNFADDAAVYTSEDPLHGQDAIRAGIESFINNTPEGRGQFRGHAPRHRRRRRIHHLEGRTFRLDGDRDLRCHRRQDSSADLSYRGVEVWLNDDRLVNKW